MSKALSLDLRTRVLTAVHAGASHREAAARFEAARAASPPSRWRALERMQGDARPGPLGGDRRSGRIEARRRFSMTGTGMHRRQNPRSKIEGKRFRHVRRPPSPADSLIQNPRLMGIPNDLISFRVHALDDLVCQ